MDVMAVRGLRGRDRYLAYFTLDMKSYFLFWNLIMFGRLSMITCRYLS